MDFDIPIASHGRTHYPVRVGFSCKNGDEYKYPASQLPYSQIADKQLIEEPDGTYHTIANFDTDPAALELRWKNDQYTFSNSASGVPSNARRGIHVYVIISIVEHPYLSCKSWMDNVAATTSEQISNLNSPKKCPSHTGQLTPPFTAIETFGGYEFYFISVSAGSSEGRVCGYNSSDAFLIPAGSHNQVNGANIYRYV